MKKSELEVEILWPPSQKKEGFKGKALSVSSKNRLGKFDILPQHANFITLILDFLTIYTPDKRKISFQFKRGVLEVYKNKVKAFLEV
jgi:F0F1-type ATP synthase epsilon subunit